MDLRSALSTLTLVFLCSTPSGAREWRVNPAGTGDAPTIRAAIDSAAAGDSLLLAPGTYTEPPIAHPYGSTMIVMKPWVTLRGEWGAAATILEANQSHVILCMDPGEYSIENVTISKGRGQYGNGGGVYSHPGANTKISRCIVKDCMPGFGASGGGLSIHRGEVMETHILDNRAPGGNGGGIFSDGSLVMWRCWVSGNESSALPEGVGGLGGGVFAAGQGTILDCSFSSNRASGLGGGLSMNWGDVERCVFTDNQTSVSTGSSGGGGVAGHGQPPHLGVVRITECAFVRNASRVLAEPQPGGAIYGAPTANVIVDRCTLVRNETGIHVNVGTVSRTIVAWTGSTACSGSGSYACCNFFGNGAWDASCAVPFWENFSADPRFCSNDPAVSLDFTLRSDSPCLAGNSPVGTCPSIGAAGLGCVASHVESRTWGSVKSLYGRP